MESMKHLTLSAILLMATATYAQKLPQPSPKGSVTQTVGITEVTINYSRPSVKGRTIFGDLVPFGQIWRTGANSATTITFDGPVSIEGTQVPAGEYAILTKPDAGAWVIMLNSNLKVSGSNGYDPKMDVATIKAQPVDGEHVETLTFTIDNVMNDGADITLHWAKTKVTFHMDAPATEQALANIDKALGEKEVSASTYGSAASFAVDRGVRLKEALAWAKKSVEMDAKFWTVRTLSLAHAAVGEKAEAIAAAKRSMAMAKDAGNEAYVKMNAEKLAEWEGGK